jgi:PAS domain S-box-containing protein
MTESSPTEQTNALLAAVVASSMDAVFSIDTSARIQTWNSAAEQLYGYTAAEAIGQPLGLLAPDPTNYAPGTRFQRVLQGEQIYFETSRRGWDQLWANSRLEWARGWRVRRPSRHIRT